MLASILTQLSVVDQRMVSDPYSYGRKITSRNTHSRHDGLQTIVTRWPTVLEYSVLEYSVLSTQYSGLSTQVLATGYWLLATGYWLLANG